MFYEKIILIFLFLIPAVVLAQEQKVTTSDGKSIVLKNDGSWQYEIKTAKVDTTADITTLVRKLNIRIARVKTGFIFGGMTLMGGAALSIIASNKPIPNASSYTDLVKLQSDLDSYNRTQKSLKTSSALLYAAGGLFMIISGTQLHSISLKKKQDQNLSLISRPNGLSISYKF